MIRILKQHKRLGTSKTDPLIVYKRNANSVQAEALQHAINNLAATTESDRLAMSSLSSINEPLMKELSTTNEKLAKAVTEIEKLKAKITTLPRVEIQMEEDRNKEVTSPHGKTIIITGAIDAIMAFVVHRVGCTTTIIIVGLTGLICTRVIHQKLVLQGEMGIRKKRHWKTTWGDLRHVGGLFLVKETMHLDGVCE